MSLESIKNKILETKKTSEIIVDEKSPAWRGLEAAKNQALQKLVELKALYRDEIRKNTTLHLVYGPSVIFNVTTPPNVYVMNHKDLAAKLSTGVLNSIRPLHGLTSYHITPLNQMLRELCKDLDVNIDALPDIGMQQQFMNPIIGRDHLVDTIESMLEFYMKSNDEEAQGHAIQAIYTSKHYLDAVETSPANSDLHLFVFVPSMIKEVKASYGRFLTNNIKTISFDNKVHAENYINTPEELQAIISGLAMVVKKPVEVAEEEAQVERPVKRTIKRK